MLLLAPVGPLRCRCCRRCGRSRPEDAVVALRLPPALLDPAVLRSLADPTAEHLPDGQRSERIAAPPLAAAALALAKLGGCCRR